MVWHRASLKRLWYFFFVLVLLISVHLLFVIITNGYLEIKVIVRPVSSTERAEPLVYTTKVEKPKRIKDDHSDVVTKTQTTHADTFSKLPWFFKHGVRRPEPSKEKIWPEQYPGNDRIVNQLMYIPPDYDEQTSPMKTILYWNGLESWSKPGQQLFLDSKCPVNRCLITPDQKRSATVDAIMFKDNIVMPDNRRPPNQIWIMYLLESPVYTVRAQNNDVINWTATYRRDSDIVAPYEKWVYYDENVKQQTLRRNYAANKTRLVAWFVSNCFAKNGRLAYARELGQYLPVDIYGSCGDKRCPRNDKCFSMLDTTYKFYLAFENSNCMDYITEKLFVNGLQHDIIPIVMGARPSDYLALAPYHSYIHTDDFASPKDLAHYLLKLDQDDELYNSYFAWKGTGEFIDTRFACRLCALMHHNGPSRMYQNINRWWANATCQGGSNW